MKTNSKFFTLFFLVFFIVGKAFPQTWVFTGPQYDAEYYKIRGQLVIDGDKKFYGDGSNITSVNADRIDGKHLSEIGINGNVITVALDGTGDYNNIQSAIDSITDSGESKPYTILIYPGVYDLGTGNHIEFNKSYTTLKGIDKDTCIIKADTERNSPAVYAVVEMSTYTTLALENLTIKNTHSHTTGVESAVAIVDGGSGEIRNCKLYGWRDTFFQYKESAGTSKMLNCYVYGGFDIVSSEASMEYYDCIFEMAYNGASNTWQYGYSGTTTIKYNNCKFYATAAMTTGDAFITAGTQPLKIYVTNCWFDWKIGESPVNN